MLKLKLFECQGKTASQPNLLAGFGRLRKGSGESKSSSKASSKTSSPRLSFSKLLSPKPPKKPKASAPARIPLAGTRELNRSFSWCESMSPTYLYTQHKCSVPARALAFGDEERDCAGYTAAEADAVQDLILLSKKQAKTLKLINGDLYIDYQYFGPLPEGCRV